MTLAFKGSKSLSQKSRIAPEKAKEIQERNRERNLIVQGIRNQGPLTVDELSKVTGMEKSKLLGHLIAMRQFGKIFIVGERDDQLVYGMPEESK